jgi:hypothetical protein
MPKVQTKSYGTMNSTASVGSKDGRVYGIFYRGGVRHIAPYIPYRQPPGQTLCGHTAGSADRNIDNLCPKCEKAATEQLGKLVFA